MAASMTSLIFLCIFGVSSLRLVSSSSICPHQATLFLNTLQSQCPLSFSPHLPLEKLAVGSLRFLAGLAYIRGVSNPTVDGNFLDKTLTSKQSNVYTSVLFYASWCPFSRNVRSTLEVLSSMFPQIEHLAVEQSSAMPSVLSRYGIHSLPSIIMVNQTSRLRYHGRKDLLSLVRFYKKTTGLDPVQYFTEDYPISNSESRKKSIMQSWNGSSLKEILTREPYLLLSILFLYLRVLSFIFPGVLSRLKAFWASYVPHLNLEIFGETSQMLGRALHMIDVKRVWTKLRLSKRVWASSLASVSLGETSSARSSS